MSNPILVPLDGSELAEESLPLAIELAVRWREPLHLVAVHQGVSVFVAPEAGPASLVGLDQEVRKNLKHYLERTAERVAASNRIKVLDASKVYSPWSPERQASKPSSFAARIRK